MSNLSEARKAFDKLEDWEVRHLLVGMFFEEKLSYTKVSEFYVAALEKQHKIESMKLQKSSMFLEAAWQHIPENKRFTRAAAAYAILQSGVFHGALIEKEYESYLASNPYEEDDNGFPKTKLKDAQRGRPSKAS